MALLAHRATGELGRGGHEDVAEGENAGQDGEQTDEQELELLVDAEGADEAEQGVQVLVGLATLLQERRYRHDLDVGLGLAVAALRHARPPLRKALPQLTDPTGQCRIVLVSARRIACASLSLGSSF